MWCCQWTRRMLLRYNRPEEVIQSWTLVFGHSAICLRGVLEDLLGTPSSRFHYCGESSCFSHEQEEFEPKSPTPLSSNLEAILLGRVAACGSPYDVTFTPNAPDRVGLKHPYGSTERLWERVIAEGVFWYALASEFMDNAWLWWL